MRLQNQTLARGFFGWRKKTRKLQRTKAVLGMVVGRLRSRALSVALQVWVAWVAASRRDRRQVGRALAFLTGTAQAAGFVRWAEQAKEQVRSPKLTVAFSQSSYIVMTYRAVETRRAYDAPPRRCCCILAS